MLQRLTRPACVWVVVGLLVAPPLAAARAQTAPVRAVLFFSPTCPHCHKVINDDLPVIFEAFGGLPRVWVEPGIPRNEVVSYLLANAAVEILLVDASQPVGGALYDSTTVRFSIPARRAGVPRLVIGDSVLVGSYEIPTMLPDLIREALAQGGIDWPGIPGLRDAVPPIGDPPASRDTVVPQRAPVEPPAEPMAAPARDPNAVPKDTAASGEGEEDFVAVEATLDAIPRESSTIGAAFWRDPVGNTLAVVLLVVMIGSFVVVSWTAPTWKPRELVSLAVPVLALLGAGVAAYLAYVETTGAQAVCGPVGDCNTVQQSPYSMLFGVIPMGIVGLVGYSAIVAVWVVSRAAEPPAGTWATFALLVMTFGGMLFSIYLTYLEPFVIGATCLWCLASAAVTTALFWLTAAPGTTAWARIRGTA